MRFALLAASLAQGCGPDCETTCNHLYSSGECNIQRPGRNSTELIDLCMNECSAALDNPGPLGDYDPYSAIDVSGESIHLHTDRQAAVWMDCVAEVNCNLLDQNACPPVW